MSFSSPARILSTNLEGALRIFVPECASKIRATMEKNTQLKSELSFLKAELRPLNIPEGIPKDSEQLAAILQQHSKALEEKVANLQIKVNENEHENVKQAEEAATSATSLIATLEATAERLKSVLSRKSPKNFTREDVWFIQPETKTEFDARIARGDHSPWGHDIKEWEEGHKLTDEH
jgi:hypothetical protein